MLPLPFHGVGDPRGRIQSATFRTGHPLRSLPWAWRDACECPGQAGDDSESERLTPTELNQLCGACHRQASDLDDDTDWDNAWNVRHQPSYLHRAACFRNSNGRLSCLTCHDPHEPLQKSAASYDARCAACHKSVAHKTAIAARTCVSCHMPQVTTSPTLRFTNHWIGIYDPQGKKLAPSRRMVKVLQPAAPVESLRLKTRRTMRPRSSCRPIRPPWLPCMNRHYRRVKRSRVPIVQKLREPPPAWDCS